jgi:hypothetical protein
VVGELVAGVTRERGFWAWFVEHEDKLFRFEEDRETRFDELAKALSKVDEDLTFEFGPTSGGKRQFVLSAGGIKRAFSAVESLFAQSPALRRFTVTKFRPRRPSLTDIEIAGLQIRTSEVFYRLAADDDPKKIGILLFLPGYTKDRDHQYGQIGYLFLDEALGEFDVETKVGFIDMLGHDSEYFEGASPIAELAAHFDQAFARRVGH